MIFFVTMVAVMLLIEYRHYKTCITPFFILGGIYLFGTVLSNTLGVFLGYNKLNTKTLFLFTLYLFVIFMGGQHFRKNADNFKPTEENVYVANETIIFTIFLIGLLGYAFSLVVAIRNYGITNVKGKSGGIFGHLGLVAVALSPMMTKLFFYTKKMRYPLAILTLLGISIVFGGKYYIFIIIVASVMSILLEKKVTIGKLIGAGAVLLCIAMVVFITIYAVVPLMRSENFSWITLKEAMLEALKHLFYYFASPFICANTYFEKPMANGLLNGVRVILNPVDVTLEAALGTRNFVDIIMEWVPISISGYRKLSNVGGVISETVYHVGYIGTAVYLYIISFMVYLINDIKCKKHIFYGTASILLGVFGLTFFGNYFTLLSIWEIILYSFVVDIIISYMNYRKVEMHFEGRKIRWKMM